VSGAQSELRRVITRTGTSRDDWRTPVWVQDTFLDFASERELVTLDPYPSPDAAHHWCAEQERDCDVRLARPDHAVWANPPYGRALGARHADEIDHLMQRSALCVALVPARPGSRWWSTLATPGRAVIVPHERFYFDDGDQPAMFPSAMIVAGLAQHRHAWIEWWAGDGWIADTIQSHDYERQLGLKL